MIKLSIDEAAQGLSSLRDKLTQGDSPETEKVTEDDGSPALAVLTWDFYEALLQWAQIPSDSLQLLKATPEHRRHVLTVAAAQAASVYTDPDLLAFEAFGKDDLYDGTPESR